MNEKISVIVPVYKVENYLVQCINSIINQTYTNLEVILVDDGSPDKCGEICDKYAEKDERIKVIHKKNGGLSDARNNGIKAATGRYIGFVDSDDYIKEDMYELLYNLMLKYNSDISICSFYKEINNKIKTDNFTNEERDFDKTEALKRLLSDEKIANYSWNKLYKKELFDNISYPVGRNYEDIITACYLFNKANKVSFRDTPKYYYRIKRKGSIVEQVTEKNINDFIEAADERYEYLKGNTYIEECNYFAKIDSIMQVHNIVMRNNMKEFYFSEKLVKEYDKIKKIIKENKIKIMKFYNLKWKLYAKLIICNRKLYWNAARLLMRRKR